MKPEKICHPFDPVFDENSRILILGSLPSVASREQNFYYGHPRNRFWKILAAMFDETIPDSIEEKKQFLLRHRIALWDVIESCLISGSSDASIKEAVPNNLQEILNKASIAAVFCNGQTAAQLYHRYQEKQTGLKGEVLPSSSPANAACSLEKLTEIWKEKIIPALGENLMKAADEAGKKEQTNEKE